MQRTGTLKALPDDEPAVAEAWTHLYRDLRPRLVRALCAMYGSSAGVEDAVDEGFVIAMARGMMGIESPEAWLFGVARNRLRRARRADRLLRPLTRSALSQNDELDRALGRLDVSVKLQRLNARDRELLIAKYYVGLTQAEVAQQFGLRLGSAASAIARAAARFRALGDRPK